MLQNFLRTFYAIPPILGFFVLSCLALISFFRGRKNRTNILFSGICILGAIINADVALISVIPDKTLALKVDRATYLFFVFSLPLYIQFVHSFLCISGRKWLEYLAYIASLLFLFFIPSDLFISGFHYYDFGIIAKAGPVYHAFSAMAAFTVIYCIFTLFMGMEKAKDNLQKNRIKYILGGLGFTALFLALDILPVSGFNIYPMGNFSFIPAIFLAFGVLKYDLLDIGMVIRRGTVYFILTGILTILYVLIIYLFHAFFMGYGDNSNAVILPFVLALMMVLLFNPLRERVQTFIDNLFYRGKYDYQKLLKEISGEMASLLRFHQIEDLLLQSIAAALQVTNVSLLIYDNEKGHFQLCANGDEPPPPDGSGQVLFDDTHPIVAFLTRHKRPLSKPLLEEKPIAHPDEKDQILHIFDIIHASLIIPMVSRDRLIGMIALGQKKSGELFVHEDLELLTTIANQGATAIENARTYEELEKLNLDLEREVEKRTAALRQALEEKERTQEQLIQSESLAAIGQLVAGTAHELNNPLSSASSLIQTSIDYINEWEVGKGNRDEVLNDIMFSLRELKRAGDIVKSLLDISRQKKTYVEPVNINIVIDDALRVLYNQYKYLPVEIERKFAENLPDVEGNFANLGQVFINVIKNALQSLPEEGGKITLTTGHRSKTDTVVVECQDTGKGISRDELKDIFKPFFTTKPVGEGTGLGLYISHEIVKRHGGDIYAASKVGKGSTFTIELPCRRER
ncbi:MAG: ATP-binding protein [Syntrophales bacterium]|nr:ATP-binding protein [Syntrophales bacterium]